MLKIDITIPYPSKLERELYTQWFQENPLSDANNFIFNDDELITMKVRKITDKLSIILQITEWLWKVPREYWFYSVLPSTQEQFNEEIESVPKQIDEEIEFFKEYINE